MATAAVVLPLACAAALVWRRRDRDAFYAALAAQPAQEAVELASGRTLATARSLTGPFAVQRLIRVAGFLAPDTLARNYGIRALWD